MPVKVRCPNCEKVLNAPDAARGKAVKCPACSEKVSVPGDDEAPAKAPAAKAKPAKAKVKKKSADDEDSFLSDLDLEKVEDMSARICPKCGAGMDEEDDECVKCGFDPSVGGLGKKATKARMKGPDPADFYKDYLGDCWGFMKKNMYLTWMTIGYYTTFTLLAYLFQFFFMWSYNLPPKLFAFGLYFCCFAAIPGWFWQLSSTIIPATLEKQTKIKKYSGDVFLSMAMGIKSLAWYVVYGIPIYLIAGIFGGVAGLIGGFPAFAGVTGFIALFFFASFPAAMAHLAMPVQWKGWLSPIMATVYYFRVIGACWYWLLFYFLTNLPAWICYGLGMGLSAAAAWGQILVIQERNRLLQEAALAGNAPKDLPELNLYVFILPCVLMFLAIPLGGVFTVFNIRGLGLIAYYFRDRLDLITREPEYKYVAKKQGEDDERAQYRRAQANNSNISLILGFLLAVGAGVAQSQIEGQVMLIVAIVLYVFAYILCLMSCIFLAQSKGYGAAVGLLGMLPGIGTTILTFLPHKKD